MDGKQRAAHHFGIVLLSLAVCLLTLLQNAGASASSSKKPGHVHFVTPAAGNRGSSRDHRRRHELTAAMLLSTRGSLAAVSFAFCLLTLFHFDQSEFIFLYFRLQLATAATGAQLRRRA